MNDFINALHDFEINEMKRIIKHINAGYLTQEDNFFIDYCLPLIELTNKHMKLLIKGENKYENFKRTN